MAGTRRPPPRRRPAVRPPEPSRTSPRARLVLTAVVTLGIVGVGVALWLAGRPSPVDPRRAAEARSALAAAGCSLRLVAAPADASAHSVVSPDGSSAAWTTDPPTAGPHYRETAVYGAYAKPLQQARVVHNLEHGAVAIEYGPGVDAATIAMLRQLYDADARGLLLAPYPGLGTRIALGAWIAEGDGGHGQGVLATCSRYDGPALSAFLAAYRFHGPERVSPASMDPGER